LKVLGLSEIKATVYLKIDDIVKPFPDGGFGFSMTMKTLQISPIQPGDSTHDDHKAIHINTC
jgi:hypothetical protein